MTKKEKLLFLIDTFVIKSENTHLFLNLIFSSVTLKLIKECLFTEFLKEGLNLSSTEHLSFQYFRKYVNVGELTPK